MHRLDRIRELDLELGIAVVEPGVTQGRLASELDRRHAGFTVDVTGSSSDTSLVGNTLERGIAYRSARADTLLGVEAVLADGTRVRTGLLSPGSTDMLSLGPVASGPVTSGLFTQSGFGVVTAIALRLLSTPPRHRAVLLGARRGTSMAELVDLVRRAQRLNLLNGVVHIADRERGELSLAPAVLAELRKADPGASRDDAARSVARIASSSWSAVGSLGGHPSVVNAQIRALRRLVRQQATVRLMHPGRLDILEASARAMHARKLSALVRAIRPLMGLTMGQPTDATLGAVAWAGDRKEAVTLPDNDHRLEPDGSAHGLLYVVPAIPFSGAAADRAVAIAKEVAHRYLLRPAFTLNTVSPVLLEGVISVGFSARDSTEVARAHAWLRETRELLGKAGFALLRLDIEALAEHYHHRDPGHPLASRLKRCLDPDDVLAPGRYD
jgi:4-cresol dehydrogenase (hydroxylating)